MTNLEKNKINLSILKYSNITPKPYIDLINKLNEVGAILESPYEGFDKPIKLRIDQVSIETNPASFRSRTYKSIIKFKENLRQNGDELIEFVSATTTNVLIGRIKTFDNGEVNMPISKYNVFRKTRGELYSLFKQVNARAITPYLGTVEDIEIIIDDVKIKTNQTSFRTQTYKSIISFKDKLNKYGDTFIKFIETNDSGALIAQIKTFDGGITTVSTGGYNVGKTGFLRGRSDFYKFLKEVNGEALSPYTDNFDNIKIKIDSVKLDTIPANFKSNMYKNIIQFKENLVDNGDIFVEFTDYDDTQGFTAKVKTIDNGEIEICIKNYNNFVRTRKEFYNILKNVNGELITPFLGTNELVEIKIDDAKRITTPTSFRFQTYNSILLFKSKIKQNGDKLIRFTEANDTNGLKALIESDFGTEFEINMGMYEKFINSKLKLINMLKEVGGNLLSAYIGDKEKVSINLDDAHIYMDPNTFKCNTYPSIINFKKNLLKNNDKFIKFISFSELTGLEALIETFDGAKLNIFMSGYDNFTIARDDFYKSIKDINCTVLNAYTRNNDEIKVRIDDAELVTTPYAIKANLIESVQKFKEEVNKNNDKFIRFIGITENNVLVSKIKTFDNGDLEIAINNYYSFVEARKNNYEFIKSKNLKRLSPYLGGSIKILIDFECEHEPHNILIGELKRGGGCPKCCQSRGEAEISRILNKYNINYISQHKFTDLVYKDYLKLDFYIPSFNLVIEYDGIQHFYPVDHFGGEEEFKERQKRDELKNEYCKENRINLLRIPYTVKFRDIEMVIIDKINSCGDLK